MPLVARDHLSRCPAEILGYIFKLVRELNVDMQMVGAISRSLLPYTRANLLRTTRVKSFAALNSLIEAGSHLGEYIETLIIHLLAPPAPPGPGEILYPDTVDEPSPSRPQLVHFFDTLSRVRTLLIKGSTRLAEVVLSMDVAYRGLPSLKVLVLGAEFSSWSNPFHPTHYDNLMYYSSLENFELHIHRTLDSISDADTVIPSSVSSVEHVQAHAASGSDDEEARVASAGQTIAEADVQTLDDAGASDGYEKVRGGAEEGGDDVPNECDEDEGEDDEGDWDDFDSEDDYGTNSEYEFAWITYFTVIAPLAHPTALQIMDVVPHPLCLSLGSTSPSTSFATFLERLKVPDCLYLLKLYNHSNNMVGHATPVDDVLLKFSRLNKLTLSAGTFGPRLFTHTLPALPLGHLTFEISSDVSKTQLLALIEGPNRLATLKHLTLNNIFAERGTRIWEDAHGVLCEETEDGIYDDWLLGIWTPSFPREGVMPLVQAGERVGVIVDGGALHALDVEEEFLEDLGHAAMMSGEYDSDM